MPLPQHGFRGAVLSEFSARPPAPRHTVSPQLEAGKLYLAPYVIVGLRERYLYWRSPASPCDKLLCERAIRNLAMLLSSHHAIPDLSEAIAERCAKITFES
jgi:hypothetical protein